MCKQREENRRGSWKVMACSTKLLETPEHEDLENIGDSSEIGTFDALQLD
jgi:hypothetical protein